MRPLLCTLLALAATLAPAAAARADDVVGYALVVGSNRPGPGQAALAFAEDDAREVAEVLRDLGGFPAARVQVVLNPSAKALGAALDKLERAVAADVVAGRAPRVFFYYSGHAKASGLSLGPDEYALETLRARLFATRAALTVVVLDACQSGAFSRIKGAEPAADFSYNSRARLDASGVAVLASSTGSELSQESDFLRSSYFTHNLLVGLRGAADDNHDGQVSLDEAYRYTYHQTLVATAATAVGSQHVSVEVDLKGAGEIPLAFPERATAALTLPADAEGQVLVVKAPARAVVAELQKAKGAALQVAVAPGRYQVLMRTAARVVRCDATAGPGAPPIDLARCAVDAPLASATKGAGAVDGPAWLMSVALGIGGGRADAYTERLEEFGYHKQLGVGTRLGVDALRRVHPAVLVGGQAVLYGGDEWRRDTDLEPLTIRWNTGVVGALGRVEQHLGPVAAFAQLGAGLAITGTTFVDQAGVATDEVHAGPAASGALGLDWIIGAGVGVTGRFDASYAPSLPNLLGDHHDTGQLGLSIGVVVAR